MKPEQNGPLCAFFLLMGVCGLVFGLNERSKKTKVVRNSARNSKRNKKAATALKAQYFKLESQNRQLCDEVLRIKHPKKTLPKTLAR